MHNYDVTTRSSNIISRLKSIVPKTKFEIFLPFLAMYDKWGDKFEKIQFFRLDINLLSDVLDL